MQQIRSYKYRLRPNRAQTTLLDAMLRDFCSLYNACLQQRVEAYKRRGLTLRYAQQAAELRAAGEALLIVTYLESHRLGVITPGSLAQALAGLQLVDAAFTLATAPAAAGP